MLSESQCVLIEKGLTEEVEPRKVAGYLCLNMGLAVAEATALRFEDIDVDMGTVAIRNIFARPGGSGSKTPAAFVPSDMPRVLPMPPHVQRFLRKYRGLYGHGGDFILTGGPEPPAMHLLQNVLSSINAKYKIDKKLSAVQLRNAFIRRCIQTGVDLYTICAYIGIKQPNVLVHKFPEYFKACLETVRNIEQFSLDYCPPEEPLPPEPRRMNLLILGAGSQGLVVKETAEAIGVFKEIAFLDDDPENRLAVDTCTNFRRYVNRYPIAIPSFGDCHLRAKWADLLEEAGFILPVLVHPMATVSPSAVLEPGSLVEMKAIINPGARIKRNVIVSAAVLIEASAVIGENSYLGGGSTIKKGAVIPPFSWIDSGSVVNAERKR